MSQIRGSLSLEHQIEELKQLVSSLKKAPDLYQKIDILNDLPLVQEFLSYSQFIKNFLKETSTEQEYLVKSIVAIGQGPIVFNMRGVEGDKTEQLQHLIRQLVDVEHFYQYLGGLIGYHLTVLTLLHHKQSAFSDVEVNYIHPEGFPLNDTLPTIRKAIRCGIENLHQMAEIYPIGGAGDRLNLVDELTGTPLPVAMLPFGGHTLLDGLIRDIQAREYLYFKLYDKQITTPIAMMTSQEKNNHAHILNIGKRENWFGRPPQSFFFFTQPLVPVITIEGNWSLSAPLTLSLKPGGHGVLWKLAQETGLFDWLANQNRFKTLIRQINNPLAGLDYTLLALLGIGIKDQKSFGFTSCERLLNSAEGMNVLIEKKTENGFSYCLTNIEYTEFEQRGIKEIPAKSGSPFSIYPTNTNIIYADLPTIQKTLETCQVPGQLINMKNKVSYIDSSGHISYMQGGRLESTMQNIADYITNEFPSKLSSTDYTHLLDTFITYSERSKTISTTKKSYQPGESPVSTPEYAHYDLLSNNLKLLRFCHFEVPDLGNFENYLVKGPSAIFLYHPALGPLYSIISQKIKGGQLLPGAELQLEIAEVHLENFILDGSALIESSCPLGHYQEEGDLHYGKESRCMLRNVTIRNKGINTSITHHFWKNQIFHHESFYVLLHESSEFEAEDVVFEGDFFFEVPPYHRLVIKQGNHGDLIKELTKIQDSTWQWKYQFDKEDRIQLQKM